MGQTSFPSWRSRLRAAYCSAKCLQQQHNFSLFRERLKEVFIYWGKKQRQSYNEVVFSIDIVAAQ